MKKKEKELVDYLDVLNFQVMRECYFFGKDITNTFLCIMHEKIENEIKKVLEANPEDDLKELFKKTVKCEKIIFEGVSKFKQWMEKIANEFNIEINGDETPKDFERIFDDDSDIIEKLKGYFNLDFMEKIIERNLGS